MIYDETTSACDDAILRLFCPTGQPISQNRKVRNNDFPEGLRLADTSEGEPTTYLKLVALQVVDFAAPGYCAWGCFRILS
ncbi:hypothetical protein [Bradyrhizobium sp. B117]|uniref:hypothetical protein n=1 Tax=Bradyrhizobium sp. B117 TaxID=3140246 RepID=UPI003182DB0D